MSRTARLLQAGLLTVALAALAVPAGINAAPAFLAPVKTESPLPAAQQPPSSLSQVTAIGNLSQDAPQPNAAQLSTLLEANLNSPAGSFTGQVMDAQSKEVLYSRNADLPVIPGSNLKLLTAMSALKNLGTETRFSTKVLRGSQPNELILQAGGDVLLSSGSSDADLVNGRAGLLSLAQLTAKALGSVSGPVSIVVDDSMFSGPALSPEWQAEDVAAGQIAPIYPMALNAAQPEAGSAAGRPQDSALAVGQAFSAALAKQGVKVADEVTRLESDNSTPSAGSTGDAKELAKVDSATVAEQVNYMLANSDNYLAEVLARMAAVKQGKAGDFTSAISTTQETVKALGIDTEGLELVDNCGLAIKDRISAAQLSQVIHVMTTDPDPSLHSALNGLPIAGLTGTLSGRYNNPTTADGAGLVRAKTGTLNTVLTLSGYVVDRDGRLLVFSFMANDLNGGPLTAQPVLDKSAAVLAGCGCR
ncbi:D-alanyl-D-alanine carboxypeptidase/D-alanyl-D-alanine-endopeptidase (penicillin-binding protein 4) [Psychromicrobium silvestre]|uniref:D-alanyl-D-alanine carboxypeptidase/D-alanyl-D-alanine-endopeptidase (Penicillin-binding protein 4) n=1 Tax=Psychromicrobium silvestre TaxID=1645614 RepID=A0A7Y9S8J3_9MICC|nr:D-alanyl-D-alanine carboxypeptidase/D-alanyl-D-alanine-endopeptidase [Psychromicrobium silvestre]NYE96051.1 D-alanyl-D-alanine carboxypeptidase/D-alanyl-D-alanine-endopeptidase (penicillin-binding protein 4) [Psychromicrobium silvestre]